MTETCAHCGASNRARANFCAGCAARLPGFAATGPSALEMLKAGAPRPERRLPRAGHTGRATGDTAALLRWLAGGGVLMMAGFLAWYLYVTRTVDAAPVPALDGPVVLQPAFRVLGSMEPQLDALPGVSASTRAAAARTAQTARAVATAPDGPTAAIGAAVPGQNATETVTRFYSALSSGDGAMAAGYVTPAKRAHGPLSGQAMSAFYRRLAQPLAIRSVRPLGGNVVEARYTYRASRTVCEGRAVITMESEAPGAAIRRISANC